ncbi:PG0541 family transporter-associated protein [Candidatus Riflebacteria bacterium]
MQMLMIVGSTTLKEEIEDFLKSAGLLFFTLIPYVLGHGKAGGPRFDDEVWPGHNSIYLLAVDETNKKLVNEWIKDYRKNEKREGLKLFSWKLQEC